MDRNALLAEAQAFFCRGMATGSYASGAKAIPLSGDADWKVFEHYNRGRDWYLQDRYYVDPTTDKSVGETRIYYEHQLIWLMSYGGFYKKEAIPCLKAALMANYTKGIFNAGRGKDGYVAGGFRYNIRTQGENSFERFATHESVRPIRVRGYLASEGGHDVWGMALI